MNRSRSITFYLWLLVTFALLIVIGLATENDRAVALRTFGLGLAAALIAVPLGGLLAWVALGQGIISRLTMFATLLLLVVPVFLHVSTWDAALGRLGWLTATEGQVLIPLVSGLRAAAWVHGVAAAPQIAVLILIGLMNGRRTFEEQALLETSPLGVFWHVTLPRLLPVVVLSVLWTLIVCSREIAATDLYQVGTLAEQIYLGFSLGQINALGGNWTPEQMEAAGNLSPNLTIMLIAWLAVTAVIVFFQLTQLETLSDQQLPLKQIRQTQTKDRNGSCKSAVGLGLLLILVVVPLCNLIVRCCFFVKPVDGVPTSSYSLSQLATTMRRAIFDYTNEFQWSLVIAAVSATVIVGVAVAISWLARKSRTWQILFAITLAISCAVPGPLLGSWITKLFTATDWPLVHWLFDRTICAPVLASVGFCWPLAPLLVWFVFRKIAADALEHSAIEGAGVRSQFWRFGVLGNGRALAGCWLITLTFCFGELSATQLVLPPGIDTIPRLMLGLLHAGVDEMTAALTLVSVGVIGLVAGCGWWLICIHPIPNRNPNPAHNGTGR